MSPATIEPPPSVLLTSPVFVRVSSGVRWSTTLACPSGEVTFSPFAPCPEALATLNTPPRSKSACVSVYVARQVVDWPGARAVTSHLGELGVSRGRGSLIPILVMVTLPVLCTS